MILLRQFMLLIYAVDCTALQLVRMMTLMLIMIILFFYGPTAPSGPWPPHYRRFMITLRHATVSRTPLDKGSGQRRDFYLTTHNTYKRKTSMPNVGFEPTIPESERPHNDTLDRAATRIG